MLFTSARRNMCCFGAFYDSECTGSNMTAIEGGDCVERDLPKNFICKLSFVIYLY